MSEILQQIATCVERGKINAASPYPPDMKGQEGADELTKKALDEGIEAEEILGKGLVVGMGVVGEKFRENKIFVPEVLMAAKAMGTAMAHLKPYFESGQVKRKGTFVIGTVSGDLHDIGKNLVAMIIEGAGYEVIDLGVDVSPEKFLAAVDEHPDCAVGLSALLTTTMVNMEKTVKLVKEKHPSVNIVVGGAPLTQEFADKIGADGYSPDPQGAVDFLAKAAAA
ncbi:MAG: cobalamin-binding protein [Chitinivibrionales bacterium]|nr:cobalamin-binding protein [Chitinivibrionales bacterium]